eukprot:TRINITY_DN54939_c0_g1_i1.p1 TRINITY_DN54939_c0_g1~~TRINITY_DN54939_c0_g1_i1.p1  ORF type:complete len:282 (+),score=49.40 TRINITY_DN54939_c0_g1_i1:44-889(+)
MSRRPRRRDRSRSPNVNQTEQTLRISKALVRFSRHKPAPGLRVCSAGSFLLSDLMDCWARKEGYSKQEVLRAVQVHMFHEDDRSQMRFELRPKPDSKGDFIIRAFPRREGGGATPLPSPRSDRPKESRSPFEGSAISVDQKLDMSLDDVIGAEGSSSRDGGARAARVHHKMSQMGLTAESAGLRRPPMHGQPRKDDPLPLEDLMEVDADGGREGPDMKPVQPKPPPGAYWTEYEDEKCDKKTWWHYNGPEGQWACAEEGGVPFPFIPAEKGEESEEPQRAG